MNALFQMIHAHVQAKRKIHYATQPVSIVMEAIYVNVQMVITFTEREHASVI